MAKYRQRLPQLGGGLFLTDGGIETTLIYHHGLDLPEFAAFDLLKDESGRAHVRTALLIRAGLGQEWIADFLTPAPREGETFATEIARVRGADPAAARADLTLSLRGPLPAALHARQAVQLSMALLLRLSPEHRLA